MIYRKRGGEGHAMAFFEGLVVSEEGEPVSAVCLGKDTYYVIDDSGFRRHVDARDVDRVVLAQFVTQIGAHREEASVAMLRMIGQEDLFTKAMVDSTLQNIDVEQLLDQQLPADVRQWLGMVGFRVVIDRHGEIVRIDMPQAPADDDDDDSEKGS
jgi:hypothetical protein